jgi:hypothetical protein
VEGKILITQTLAFFLELGAKILRVRVRASDLSQFTEDHFHFLYHFLYHSCAILVVVWKLHSLFMGIFSKFHITFFTLHSTCHVEASLLH